MKLISRYITSYSLVDVAHTLFDSSSDMRTHGENGSYIFSSASAALKYFLIHKKIQGKIIVPAYTCERVIAAIRESECEPLFVDTEPDTGTMSISALSKVDDKEIVALIITPVFGMTFDRSQVCSWSKKRNILVIEDRALISPCLQEAESTLADIHIASFGKGKFINLGMGGMLVEGESKLSEGALSELKTENSFKTLINVLVNSQQINRLYMTLEYCIKRLFRLNTSYSYSPSKIEVRVYPEFFERLVRRMTARDKLDNRIAHSRRLSSVYAKNLSENAIVRIPERYCADKSVSSFFPLQCENRDALLQYLRKEYIDVGKFFDYCIGNIIDNRNYKNGLEFSSRILLLPLHQNIDDKSALRICSHINSWSTEQ